MSLIFKITYRFEIFYFLLLKMESDEPCEEYIKIVYDRQFEDPPIYHIGDTVTGKVVVMTKTPSKLREIFLSIEQNVQTDVYNKPFAKAKSKQFLFHMLRLLKSPDDGKLKPGLCEFPFKFHLSQDCVTALSKNGSNEFTINVELDMPEISNKTRNASFLVYRNFDTARKESSSYCGTVGGRRSPTGCGCFKFGRWKPRTSFHLITHFGRISFHEYTNRNRTKVFIRGRNGLNSLNSISFPPLIRFEYA